MLRKLTLSALGIGSLFVAFSGSSKIGFSVTVENGIGQVSAGTSPLSLGAALVILIAYVLVLDPNPDVQPGSVPASTLRRGFAWFCDLILALTAVSAVIALLPLASEAIATGQFQWQFERNSVTLGDWLVGFVGIALMYAGLAIYWGLPPARGGQTIGQAVSGLRVVSATSEPLTLRGCLLRGALQPFAPLLWFTRFLSSRRSYWYDDFAHAQVVTTTTVRRAA